MRYYLSSQESWRFARLDGILMLRYDQIHIEGDAEIDELMKQHRGFVYIRPKDQHMDVFMLGRDNPAVEELGAVGEFEGASAAGADLLHRLRSA